MTVPLVRITGAPVTVCREDTLQCDDLATEAVCGFHDYVLMGPVVESHQLFWVRKSRCLEKSLAILAQAISCSNVRGVFPVHERFWFCLVQASTTQFCSFPSFLMARARDGTNVPISPEQASSWNSESPNGSLPDLEGTGFRASTMDEKINEICLQLPLFMQNAARIENCVQTLAQTVGAQTTKITNVEQSVGSLVARITSLTLSEASGTSSPDSARSWNMLGQSNGSTATGSLGSHGPGVI